MNLVSFTLKMFVILVLPVLLGTSCQEAPANPPPVDKLVITGSSTIAPLVNDITKKFETLQEFELMCKVEVPLEALPISNEDWLILA